MRQVKGNVSVISSDPLWQCTVQNSIIKIFAWSSIKVDGNINNVKKLTATVNCAFLFTKAGKHIETNKIKDF